MPQREPFIDHNVMTQLLEPGELLYLRAKFYDPSFIRVLQAQRDAMKERIAMLDPALAKTPEEYFQKAKDMHLALSFWNEFLMFIEAWKLPPGAPE